MIRVTIEADHSPTGGFTVVREVPSMFGTAKPCDDLREIVAQAEAQALACMTAKP